MVAGLKFLSKKSFNPQNLTNQKRVWERQQQEKKEDRRINERNEQLKRERDDEELARARGDTVKLGFLYAAPPGMQEPQKESTTADYYSDQEDDRKLPASDPKPFNDMLCQRQPGDDDAAAAFRLMLARPADEADNVDGLATGNSAAAAASRSRYALQGSSVDVTKTKANLSALEKAVGRRKDTGSAITLDEQVQRFPALANAPRAQGMSSMDIGVSFKPLGTQIRNVRCMACQKWGHSKGDRECEHQWDPFSGRASTLITRTKQQEAEEEGVPLGGSKMHRNKSRHDRHDSSSSSEDSDSSSEESRRERKRRKKRKKHEDKAKRRKDSKRRKRSKSEDEDFEDQERDQERSRSRKSHKRHRKSDSRHDDKSTAR
jgi:CBF1 interacting corepressor